MKHDPQYAHIEENEFATVFAEDVEIQATITTQDTMLIKGKVINSHMNGSMVCIASEGYVQGEMKTDHLVVSGEVDGTLNISDNLHILKDGKVKGFIEIKHLIVDKGASINGTCKMLTAELSESA